MANLWSLVTSVVVIVLLYLVYRLTKTVQKLNYMVNAFKDIPTLPRHWFFGNVKQIPSWSDFVFKMQKIMVDERREKMYVFWLFNLPIIMVTHPDTAKDIMRSSEPKSLGLLGYGALIPWLGHSLLISSGTKWERNRRLLTPAFHFDILRPYLQIFNQVADVLIEKMTEAAKAEKSFEIFRPAGLATLDSLLQCALSYKGNVQQTGGDHPYVNAVRRLTILVTERTLKPHHHNDTLYRLSTEGREFYRLCDYVHNFSAKIISERRSILNKNPDILQKRRLDFLDILLTAKDSEGQGLTDEEIRDEVDTFMFAGHDTTSSVLGWSLYALGKFPEQQRKVYEDVHAVIGDRESAEWDDLGKMKYLSCFIKEVMRLYTPVPVATRLLSKPLVIDGITVPAGTPIDLGFYHIHHHPDVWTDPWEFKPERFEKEDILTKDPYSFVPFSAGPRNCIGQNFAQNEDKVMVARIVNRFEVSLDPDHEVVPCIEAVLRTETGIYLKLKDRKK